MVTGLRALETKSLDAPDETRPFAKGKLEVVTVAICITHRAPLLL
jgi:hypothetical protein